MYLLKNSQAVKKWCGLRKLKVGKSKVAAKNGCNDVNANKLNFNNDCGIIVIKAVSGGVSTDRLGIPCVVDFFHLLARFFPP